MRGLFTSRGRPTLVSSRFPAAIAPGDHRYADMGRGE
jgi:hypothetical protein